MIGELAVRFILGGVIVCIFAVIGDVLRPKSFAGIFGAAPSVALATLGLTLATKGGTYTGIEGRSMIVGAAALLAYSAVSTWLLIHRKCGSIVSSVIAGVVWFVVALGIWGVALR